MKIELNETEIAQAIVNWLSAGGILKNEGPYDVNLGTNAEGKVTAFLQPTPPRREINETVEERG